MNKFRERLKKLREKEGTQPCVLAELCGISKNSILRYERDGVIPEIVSVVKIADHFNVSVDYLLGRTDVKAKLFCPEIAGLFCRIAGLFCHDSRANLSLKPVCFGIAIS